MCRQELATWPQYSKRIVRGPGGRAAVHLDVFGYYVFWTAFYVLRGSQTAAPAPVVPRQGRLAYSAIAPSLGTVRKVGVCIQQAQHCSACTPMTCRNAEPGHEACVLSMQSSWRHSP